MNNIYVDKRVINIIDDSTSLDLVLKEKQIVIINCFFNKVVDIEINVEQVNDSYLVVNYAGYVIDNTDVNISVNVNGNNNKTIVKVRTIEENNHADFYVNVKAKEETVGNEITEDLKAINEEGTITFMPVLQIDTNEVQAEHYATIGSFDEKELFYLETKMISTQTAKDILKKSFMYHLFSDSFLRMLDNGKEYHE